MKLNGSEVDKRVLAKRVADEFGTDEITEKKRENIIKISE